MFGQQVLPYLLWVFFPSSVQFSEPMLCCFASVMSMCYSGVNYDCMWVHAQLYPILWDPMDSNLQDSWVHRTLQARILSGLPCLPPGDFCDPGIKPLPPALAGKFFTTSATWEDQLTLCMLVAQLCLTLLWSHGLYPARLLWPWDFSGKNTGVGSHSLLQGIFLTQGLNPGLRWGNSGNSGRIYFSGLQNHCRWWLQPWN